MRVVAAFAACWLAAVFAFLPGVGSVGMPGAYGALGDGATVASFERDPTLGGFVAVVGADWATVVAAWLGGAGVSCAESGARVLNGGVNLVLGVGAVPVLVVLGSGADKVDGGSGAGGGEVSVELAGSGVSVAT